ncbi:Cas10/Cmr2 second palm domain-containing protein [Stappia sp.]|uniref:Cas10/Cmr2 second palm domain-containing protein n=1 Tax=Stappia sp. TaxID=1870903 RepID=UPI003D0BD28F
MVFQAYLFEIRQIQSYVFATGKLRDASGASELIDAISGDVGEGVSGLAGRVLQAVGLDPTVFRAAGGVLDFTCLEPDLLRRFRATFRLTLAKQAPGLVFNDCTAAGETVAKARDAARNGIAAEGPVRGAAFPLGSPMLRPAQRSGGNPAILRGATGQDGRCVITKEFADLPTLAKRQYLKRGQTLAGKFVARNQRAGLQWPTVFREDEDEASDRVIFPFGEKSIPRVAVLHADGNGMGKLFVEAVQRLSIEEVRFLSGRLTAATQAAVQCAMLRVVEAAEEGVVPARPILLGGDDVTVILRADLASQFALDFACAYERLATAAVRGFAALQDWPVLTTKIGFVVIGPNQPFAQAYRLAEELAREARDPGQSKVAFYRVTGAAIPEKAEDIAAQGKADEDFTLWRAAHGMAEFESLRALARLLDDDDVGRGGLRKVPEVVKTSREDAQRLFVRAKQVVKARGETVAHELDAALAAAGMPDLTAADGGWVPLLAAHDLAHIDRSQA